LEVDGFVGAADFSLVALVDFQKYQVSYLEAEGYERRTGSWKLR
jgi:hypothetical protein